MAVRKIPSRLCIGCNEPHPKREMIRIVRSPEGEYAVDFTGKKPGRGSYLCRNRECFEAAKKNRGFERSFKSSIDKGIYDALEAQLFGTEEI